MSEKYRDWMNNPKIKFLLCAAQMDDLDETQQRLFEKSIDLTRPKVISTGRMHIVPQDEMLRPIKKLAKTMENVKKVGPLGRSVIVRTTVINVSEVLEQGRVLTFTRQNRVIVNWS